MILQLTLSAYWLTMVLCQELTGIFNNVGFVYQPAANYINDAPNRAYWVASVDWAFDGHEVNTGDTFTLSMPCISSFVASSGIDLKVDSKSYASCYYVAGNALDINSQLRCTILPTVEELITYSGTIELALSFSIGSSTTFYDLTCAALYSSGPDNVKQLVTWTDGANQLSGTAAFEPGPPYPAMPPDELVFASSATRNYALGGVCPDGHVSGTIGLTLTSPLDCSTLTFGFTNDLNAWYFPRGFTEQFSHTISCNGKTATVEYSGVPAGYRPFLNVENILEAGVQKIVTNINTYLCVGDTSEQDNGFTLSYGTYNPPVVSDSGAANGIVILTSTYTGSTPQLTTLPPYTQGGSKTIVYEVPSATPSPESSSIVPSATPSSESSSIVPSATPSSESSSIVPSSTPSSESSSIVPSSTPISESSSVEDNVPSSTPISESSSVEENVPSSTPISESSSVEENVPSSTSIPESSSVEDNVPSSTPISESSSVEENVPSSTPIHETTITTYWTGSYTDTTTLPYTSGGTRTIQVNVPVPTTTITKPWTGDYTQTTTLPIIPGDTVTVEVNIPVPTITITKPWTGDYTQTTTLPIIPGDTVTVEVNIPVPTILITVTDVHTTYTTRIPLPQPTLSIFDGATEQVSTAEESKIITNLPNPTINTGSPIASGEINIPSSTPPTVEVISEGGACIIKTLSISFMVPLFIMHLLY